MVGADLESGSAALLTVPLFVAGLMYLSIVVGRRVLLASRVGAEATVAERVVLSGAIGLGLVQFVPVVLGVFGVLSVTSTRVVLAIAFVLALFDLPAMARALRRWWSGVRRPATWKLVWVAILAAPLVIAFFSALAPSFDPDGVGYHIAAPKQWLRIGSLEFLPSSTYTNGPMGTEMLYLSALAVVGDAGAKLLHLVASLLAACGIFFVGQRAGRHVGAPYVGYVAVALWMYSPVGIYPVIAAGYSEGTATMAIVASALAWILWYDSSHRAWLVPAALLSGFAVTFKLTSIVFPVALAVLTILIVRRRGREATGFVGMSWRGAAWLVALCALPMVPWMIRSTIVVDNPVFPVFARWIPSRGFPPERSEAFESYNRYMIWGTSMGYDLSLGARKAILAAVAGVVVIVGALVWWRQRNPVHRAVTIVVIGTTVVQLYAAGLYFRYWTPLFAVIQIPVLAYVLSRIDRRVVQYGVVALSVLVAGVELRASLQGDPGRLVQASLSSTGRDEARAELLPLVPLYDAANELAEPGEAVAMGYGCQAFYIDGPVMCLETLETTMRLDDWDAFNEQLERYGVAYVIAPTSLADGERPPEFASARAVGDIVRDDEFARLSQLLQERGELIATELDRSLFRLRAAEEDG